MASCSRNQGIGGPGKELRLGQVELNVVFWTGFSQESKGTPNATPNK